MLHLIASYKSFKLPNVDCVSLYKFRHLTIDKYLDTRIFILELEPTPTKENTQL